jgi:hypothetical protein
MFSKNMSFLKRFISKWLAITSDSNPLFKMGKACRQKDGCSSHWVMFTRAQITLYPCVLDLMYFLVHYFLVKKRSLLYITNTFPSMILRKSICSKLGGTMIFENQSNLQFYINLPLNRCQMINLLKKK